MGSLHGFSQALRRHKPGDAVAVRWRRGGQEMEGQSVLMTRH
jgi:S1-C subfamily serine protease